MAPSRRRGGGGKASSTAAAAAKKQWKIGDLVLAKVKGFPAWPATVSEPEKWGYSTDWKKVLVYFFGTKQIAFCNPADVEAFTEEKKKTLLGKRQGKGSDFVRAVEEIIDCFEKSKKQDGGDEVNSGDEGTVSNAGAGGGSVDKSSERNQKKIPSMMHNPPNGSLCASADRNGSYDPVEVPVSAIELTDSQDQERVSEEPAADTTVPDLLKEKKLSVSNFSKKRSRDKPLQNHVLQKRTVRKSRSSIKVDSSNFETLIMAVNDVSKNDDDDYDEVPNAKRNRRIRKTLDDAVWYDAVSPISLATCVSNGSSGENTSEIVATNSDTVSLNEGSTLESTCKSENADTAEDYIDGDIQVCGALQVQAKAVVIKKKRKLNNRKRIPHSAPRIAASPDKEFALDVKGINTIPISPNATEKLTGSYWKADGDEHLPLVKRARVRMSKIPTEEKETHGSVCTDDKSSKEASVNNSVSVFSGCGNSSLNGRTSLEMKEIGNGSSSTTSSNHCTAYEPLAWKPKKFQFRSCSVDGEAALPPSKRLHRALEAMSANAAENVQDEITEQQVASVTISSNGGPSYREKGSTQAAMNEEAGNSETENVLESGVAEHSCDDRNMSGRSEMIGSLTSPSCEMPTKASSEEKFCERKELSSESHSSKTVIDLDESSFDTRSSEIEVPVEPSQPSSAFGEKHEKLELAPGVIDPCKLSPMDQDNLSGPSNQCSDDKPKGADLPPPTDKADGENGSSVEIWRSEPASEAKVNTKVSPSSNTNLLLSGGSSCVDTKYSEPPSEENTEVENMCEVMSEVQEELVTPSPETTMKGLIAAAQAKRQLPRTTSFSDDSLDDKVVSDTILSPSTNHRIGYSEKVTPHISSICHLPTLDDHNSNHVLHNDGESSEVPPPGEKPTHLLEMDKEGKMEPAVSHGQILSKWTASETSAARKSFEGFLGTLSRTKDSIGKATRLAIDCVKCGIAGEVVEVLARSLENESSLHRRVDLFFLVDSITQCSRGQKGICLAGDIGDTFLSAIQAALPRLLAVAAPPGSAARENRKQCLKVLKLWLERKTLPESVIRHHMQELDLADAPFIGSSSRRPSRTERSLDDPVREMEGMLVDEYGSNANFQLAGILMPRMLEVEEEGSDTDEKSFEAVTPEHEQAEIPREREATPTSVATVKHHRILEDVDGELEMEDVAPSCEGDIDFVHISQGQYEQRLQLPFAPPLPEDRPPSPPPLPSSPPPLPSSLQSFLPPPPLPAVHSFADNADSNYYANTCSLHNGLQLPTPHQPGTGNANSLPSDTVHTQYYGYKDFVPPVQRPALSSSSDPSCSFPGPPHSSVQTGNNAQHIDGAAALHNKNYHLQPPPPMLSNQFSYVQADQRAHSWMEASSSSFTNRFQFGHDMHMDNMYDSSHERTQHDTDERCRLPPPPVHPGPVHSDNTDCSYAPAYYGPPDAIPNREWSYPPRSLNYRHSTPNRRPEISGANALNFWRPR